MTRIPKGYKQTEVGVIPEDWDQTTIAEVAVKVGSGITPRGGSNKYKEYGRPFVRSQNVGWGCLLLDDIAYIDDETHNTFSTTELKEDDVLLNITGASIGRSALANQKLVGGNVNQHVCIIRSNLNGTNSRFINFILLSSLGQRQIDSFQAGGNREGLNFGQIKSIRFPLPPTKAEQEAIAEALSDADALIESLEQLIAKKRQIKQGAMQELLRPKDSWEQKMLGTTSVLKARIGWQGLTTAEYLDTGDFYLVTGTDFKGGYIDWGNCHYVDESRYKQDRNIQLRENDVLVTKDGTIGKVALIDHLDKPATLNSGVFVIRPIEDAFHPAFFYYLLCSDVFTEFLGQLSAGSTINHLYQKDIVNFIYRTPVTLAEQTAIAAILSDMDAEIAALEARLAKTRQIKRGMMQKLLTGSIRLIDQAMELPEHHLMSGEDVATSEPEKTHNWAFHEAVVISVLAAQFAKPEFPLGRKRYTKLSYLLHRKAERAAPGYLKKAAGPYNPKIKYAGPEKIAQESCYVRHHDNGKFKGFIAAEKINLAEDYFIKWYGTEMSAWLEKFRYKTNDELERLATVDMAKQELLKQGKTVDVASIRALIASELEWIPKLERPIFSDSGIAAALAECRVLFEY